MLNREIGPQAKKFSDMLAWVIVRLGNTDELLREMQLDAGHSGHGVKIDKDANASSCMSTVYRKWELSNEQRTNRAEEL
jgi:hypothetical protein